MALRTLGSTDMEVSPLGLGTVKFGRNQGVKYPHAFALPSDGEIRNLLDLAWDLGINLLDTAPAYGSSEERLGQLLDHSQDWIIVTKVGENFSEGCSLFRFFCASHAFECGAQSAPFTGRMFGYRVDSFRWR